MAFQNIEKFVGFLILLIINWINYKIEGKQRPHTSIILNPDFFSVRIWIKMKNKAWMPNFN